MGWTNRNGKRYFYQSYRDHTGRVRTKYIGTGAAASALEKQLDYTRTQRRSIIQLRTINQSLVRELNEIINPFINNTALLFRAVMAISGFRGYPNGIWRKRRTMIIPNDDPNNNHDDHLDHDSSGENDDGRMETIADAIRAAERGDERGLKLVRNFINANPNLWQGSGDVATLAIRQWVHRIAGNDVMQRETIFKRTVNLKMKLRSNDSNAVEELLIERVVLTWLRVNHFERLTALSDSPDVCWARHLAEQLQRAEKSHTHALRDIVTHQHRKPSIASMELIAMEVISAKHVPQVSTEKEFDPTKHRQDYLDMPD